MAIIIIDKLRAIVWQVGLTELQYIKFAVAIYAKNIQDIEYKQHYC